MKIKKINKKHFIVTFKKYDRTADSQRSIKLGYLENDGFVTATITEDKAGNILWIGIDEISKE